MGFLEENGLVMDNILSTAEVDNLFADEDLQDDHDPEENSDNKTTEVNPDTLFDDEPESVGSEDNTSGDEEDANNATNSSPNPYSSIAQAFADEGIFPDLDDESIKNIKSPEDLKKMVDSHIQNLVDQRNQRADKALNAGVEVTEIQKYENTLKYLNSIKDTSIEDESEEGEKLRKNLIYQDFINRGYSKERALREVNKSFNANTDIEDAKEALKSNKEFFKEEYDDLIEEAEKEKEEHNKKLQKEAEKLKNSILEDSKLFGDFEVDKTTRKRIFDNISKPVYKDPDTGDYLTAIQKYQKENSLDFIKNVGLAYTLTNGFKDFGGLLKNKVRKETNQGFRNLERVINNTSRDSNGNLKFVGGGDKNSYIGKGFSLDV